MERKKPQEMRGQEVVDWIKAQESFEKKKHIEKYSQPIEPTNPRSLIKKGFQPIDRDGITYFARKLGKELELKRFDDNYREIEHWMGNSDVLETSYDEEGYVTTFTHMRGTGWGNEKVLRYTTGENGEKTLSEIIIQNFIGEPAAAWGAGRPIRGKNIGEPILIDIKK